MKLRIKSNSNQIPTFICFPQNQRRLKKERYILSFAQCTGLVQVLVLVPVLWVSHAALNIYSILLRVLSVEWKLGSAV